MREVPAIESVHGSGAVTCCGNHHDRCKFGRPHIWSVWFENARLQRTSDTLHCLTCGGVCTAAEDAAAAPEPCGLDECDCHTV